jgi:hypothetical protein
MQTIDRWRNWTPDPKKFDEYTEDGLTKLTKPTSVSFVSSIPAQMQNFSPGEPRPETMVAAQPPEDDPAAWREPFQAWKTSRCVRRDRCFGGMGCLHIHFADWAISHDAVPCTRQTFERLLTDAGFIIADGLVESLLLREDMEAATLRTASKTAVRNAHGT